MVVNNIIFKGRINKIGKRRHDDTPIEVLYRIINIDNLYFFAEELATGIIFPVYSITIDNKKVKYRCRSLIEQGKYFIYGAVEKKGKHKYELNLERQSVINKIATKDEIKDYLYNRKNNEDWIEELLYYAEENKYLANEKFIYDRIQKEKSKNLINEKDREQQIMLSYNSVININTIREYGSDLSESNNLSCVIGRDSEIKEIIKNICIKEKSVLLLGEAGCGKTAIVETLALSIKKQNNTFLNNKLIFNVNTSSIVSDAKYLGEFEDNLNKLLNFAKRNKKQIILFIDEIHTLYGLGKTNDSAIDAINILKPFISNRDIIIIGATTKNEYYETLANDMAFARRFEKIEVSNPNNKMCIKILYNYIKELEEKYKLKFDFNDNDTKYIIDKILELTNKKNQKDITDVPLTNPGIGKDLIESCFAEAIYKGNTKVDIEDLYTSINNFSRLSKSTRNRYANYIRNELSTRKYLTINNEQSKILSITKKKDTN